MSSSVIIVDSALNLLPGVVHAVSYSLLLLNTDLHVAELATRMSRSQFVRNTLNAIQMQLHPERYNNASTPDLTSDDSSSIRAFGRDPADATGATRSPKRSGSIASWSSVTKDMVPSAQEAEASTAACPDEPSSALSNSTISMGPSSAREPKSPQRSPSAAVYDRNWESDMENMLKVRNVCTRFTVRDVLSLRRMCTTQSKVSRSFSLLAASPWVGRRRRP